MAAQGSAAAGGLRRRRRRVGSPAGLCAMDRGPDDQFLLDVTIRQLRLGDGVRAYRTPEGTVRLGRLFVDARRADAHRPRRQSERTLRGIEQDLHRLRCRKTYHTARRPRRCAPGTESVKPGGMVSQGGGAVAMAHDWRSADDRRLVAWPTCSGTPSFRCRARRWSGGLRGQQIKPAQFDLASLPQVRVPYRHLALAGTRLRGLRGRHLSRQGWRAGRPPVVDLCRRWIAHLSYDAQISTNQKGTGVGAAAACLPVGPQRRFAGTGARKDCFAVRGVEGFDSKLSGSSAFGRRGRHRSPAQCTNRVRPLTLRRQLAGRLGSRNLPQRGLARFHQGDCRQDRYVFDDVQLLYGENRVRVVLYGSRGKCDTGRVVNVGQDNVPPGKSLVLGRFR